MILVLSTHRHNSCQLNASLYYSFRQTVHSIPPFQNNFLSIEIIPTHQVITDLLCDFRRSSTMTLQVPLLASIAQAVFLSTQFNYTLRSNMMTYLFFSLALMPKI